MGFSIGVSGRSGMIIRRARRIGSRTTHQHLASWPGIAGGDWYVKGVIVDWARRAVIEPVMGLKLDPSGRQQIEDLCRLKIIGAVSLLLSPEQTVADQPRAGVKNVAVAIGINFA